MTRLHHERPARRRAAKRETARIVAAVNALTYHKMAQATRTTRAIDAAEWFDVDSGADALDLAIYAPAWQGYI